MSESGGFATVAVEIFDGAVGFGESILVDFFTTDDSAISKHMLLRTQMLELLRVVGLYSVYKLNYEYLKHM